MRKYFRSIRFRIWIAFVLFTVGITIILYFSQMVLTPVFYRYMKTQESFSAAADIKRTLTSSDSNVTDITNIVKNLAITHQMDILVNFPKLNINISQDKSGSVNFLSSRINDNVKAQLYNSKNDTLFLPLDDDGLEAMLLATYIGDKNNVSAYIFIYSYLEPIGTTLSIINTLLFICANVILIIGCVISIMLSSHIANPLVNISKNAKELITGNFHMEVKPYEYDEIATLAENLNQASYEIARTETLRKDLMANVSHDLRTPLTMIKAYAEMIRDLSGNNPEKREKHLAVIIDETDRLTGLVADILNLSKLQSGFSTMDIQLFNFSEHLHDLIGRFSMLDDAKNYRVELQADNDIFIKADMQRIEQVVYNLVNNAINYIGDDKVVLVKLAKKNRSTARFEVIDHGVGIPKEQIPYIWERYYKVDRSENHKRAAKGSGLGLSIVKGVLDSHGFIYGCDSTVDEGSCFWFEFALPSNSEKKALLK